MCQLLRSPGLHPHGPSQRDEKDLYLKGSNLFTDTGQGVPRPFKLHDLLPDRIQPGVYFYSFGYLKKIHGKSDIVHQIAAAKIRPLLAARDEERLPGVHPLFSSKGRQGN